MSGRSAYPSIPDYFQKHVKLHTVDLTGECFVCTVRQHRVEEETSMLLHIRRSHSQRKPVRTHHRGVKFTLSDHQQSEPTALERFSYGEDLCSFELRPQQSICAGS